MSGREVTPADRARWLVGDQLREVSALLGLGVGPLDGIRAALFVRDVAARHVRTYAEQARADGVGWAQIGTALGLADKAERTGTPVGEAAWSYVIEGLRPGQVPDDPWRQHSARWTCGSCGQRVTDRGPFSPHPDDCEQGHARDCARYRAALAAFEQNRGGDGDV